MAEIAPVVSRPITATAGLVYDLNTEKLEPLKPPSGQSNPAAMTMQEAMGEKPKRKYTALKIATGLAALGAATYGLARGGLKYIPADTPSKFKGAIRTASETIVNKTHDLGRWVKNIFKKGEKDAPKETPKELPSTPPEAPPQTPPAS